MSSIPEQNDARFPVLVPTLQIGFYRRLIEAQSEYLLPALLDHVASLDITHVDKELSSYAGEEKLRQLAKHGLRGELLFSVPYVLSSKPNLIGYYRLVLGFSQKEFYTSRTFGVFSKMERSGILSEKVSSLLPDLCVSLNTSAWILANQIPVISQEILNALALITLGGQLRGSYNTSVGQIATKTVFDVIKSILGSSIEVETDIYIEIHNAAGRKVRIEFAPDPDIAIREQLTSGRFNNRIAIEIKGGKDISNIHNRLGEAEKSHQKAKEQGFTQFWTIINVDYLDPVIARRESPTTTAFFNISRITNPLTPEHERFKELLLAELGLKGE
jgi:hypothetical protein